MFHHQQYASEGEVFLVINATQRWRSGAGLDEAVSPPSGDCAFQTSRGCLGSNG